jgi:predicted metal-dependent peptidase
MEQKKEVFDLNMHTAHLLQNEPFYAAISRHIEKIPTTSIPTAGVRVNSRGYYEMLYNPEFFGTLPHNQRLGVLKHEYYHLLLNHVEGRLPEEGMSKLWNIATDLAINSHLQGELPDSACMPGSGPFSKMELGLSSERYFALLKKEMDEDPDGGGKCEGEGDGNFDDHSGWGQGKDCDEDSLQKAKQRLKKMLQDGVREASQKGWGSVPEDMREEIKDRITSKVDWKKVLRYFIKTSQASSRRSTVKRINRRFPYIHAGRRIDRTANIAISIDQSGSVGDDMLAAFFSELEKLAELATFTLIPFDTRVDESLVYEWKKGQRKTWERVMCGGTDFNAPTKYVNKNKFDGHIVLTDMYAPKPVPSKCQRMWMTTMDQVQNPYFDTTERIIGIIV